MDETPPDPIDAHTDPTDSPVPQRQDALVGRDPEPETGSGEPRRSLIAMGIATSVILVVLLIASQIYLISTVSTAHSDIETLEDQIGALDASVAEATSRIEAVAETTDKIATATEQSGATPVPSVQPPSAPVGFLPRFTGQGPDPAVGMKLTEVSGTGAYTGEATTIDPADGTKRVWMVWAHWCPYCQQELPELNAWWPASEVDFPHSELVTITTSMDPARGNPLDGYLESEQFGFPVIVDGDGILSAQTGVNAFPFWLVTDGDGTVLFRTAGLLQIEQVEQLFNQLETLEG